MTYNLRNNDSLHSVFVTQAYLLACRIWVRQQNRTGAAIFSLCFSIFSPLMPIGAIPKATSHLLFMRITQILHKTDLVHRSIGETKPKNKNGRTKKKLYVNESNRFCFLFSVFRNDDWTKCECCAIFYVPHSSIYST